jgi:hypothetical protein
VKRVSALSPSIEELTRKYVRLWHALPAEIPDDIRIFTETEQRERQQRVEDLILEMKRAGPESARRKIRRFAYETEGGAMSPFRSHEEDFSGASREFVEQAHAFDRRLGEKDIHQALRNFWVFNALQLMFTGHVGFQQGAFAYSLLYPYTDNFFDDREIGPGRKRAFGEWLSGRLSGDGLRVAPGVAKKVDRLLLLIEEEFPRRDHPLVYEGLLAIHDAQLGALERSGGQPREVEWRSVRKGGTSVLADALLVRGWLHPWEIEFSFRFGVLLQFMDDLQDGWDDGEAKAVTLFSEGCPRSALHESVRRLIHFLFDSFGGAGLPGRGEARQLREPMQRACIALAVEAVWQQAQRFDRGLVERIVSLSAYHPAYLASLRRRAPALRKRFPGGIRSILLAAD